MKITVRICVVLVLSVVWCSVFSCNKGNNDTSPKARIVGRWEKVGFGTDDNSNGSIDQWEKNTETTTITNILEFKKDSTGIEYTTQAPDLGVSWYFGGDVSLYTIYNTGDTFTYKVILLSGSDLHITTISKLGLSAYYYKKK